MKKISTTMLILGLILSCFARQPVKTADWKYQTRENYEISNPNIAHVPMSGVKLKGGMFDKAMKDNITYLLESFSVDDMLYHYRLRTGVKNPPRTRPLVYFWETDLEGQVAGRFLMGAGNTLRWMEHPELRQRLNAVVDGIDSCKSSNGYIMAFPPEKMLDGERGNYTRAWVTHGLIDAGYAGNPKAFLLLRGFYDWFDQCKYLLQILRTPLGYNGMIGNSRMYFTPVGKRQDIEVLQKYYQEDYWLYQLGARDERAIWKYPYNRPHCYEITAFEAYLDMYRATGDRKYLDAVEGGWELIHNSWEHVGGSIAICEHQEYPPKSYFTTWNGHTGETCGSVFWIFLNQRFHLLYPNEEKFMSEIEKSIYNICIASQDGEKGIWYHAILHGRKEKSTCYGSCCEGQASRVFGALPEFIYSLAEDGIYLNLFEASEFAFQTGSNQFKLDMKTSFPLDNQVSILISTTSPATSKIRIRIPSWAVGDMPILVNGEQVTVGKPGSYQVLDRIWNDGDKISFVLPMDFRVTEYAGADQYPKKKRYALEYGPILLAAVGLLQPMAPKISPLPTNSPNWWETEKNKVFADYCIVLKHDPKLVKTWLKPKSGQPLHFIVEGAPEVEYVPYWEVGERYFTCYPIMEGKK